MERLIYTYSLVKTLYEQGKDYIDSFWPFALKVMPRNNATLSLSDIQKRIRDESGLDIPQHSLSTIITRSKRKDYMAQGKGRFWLTEKGSKYLDTLEPESAVQRRVNQLLEDMRIYVNMQLGSSLSLTDTYDIVLSFVHANIDLFLEFCNPDSSILERGLSKQSNTAYDHALVRYFEIAKKRKPSDYRTLTDIVYGSVISVTASNRDIAAVNKKFARTKVFLDTNYLFSILELGFPEFSEPAKELFDLLKLYKFEVRTFDFTIDEMVRVLKGYAREQYLFAPGVPVDSIYSSLKNRGFTSEDVREFIIKIEDRIWSLGVEIEPTSVQLRNYNPLEDEYRTKLSRYKPDQRPISQNHDLAAIQKIKEIRKTPRREIENSRAFFLTSDLRLSQFDFLEMGHRQKATVCEVIPDKLLTNILWLKNPTITKDVPLKSIIAIHSRGMFIDRRIWRRFFEIVRELREEGKIGDKDISMLFYNHRVEKVLEVYDDTQTDDITSQLVLAEIESANKAINEETKGKLTQQKEIFEKRLTVAELKKNREFEIRLSKIKYKLKAGAHKKAKRSAIIQTFLPVIISFVLFMYFLLTKGWMKVAPIFALITGILATLNFLGIKVSVLDVRTCLQKKAFQRIYRKELIRIGLEDDLVIEKSK